MTPSLKYSTGETGTNAHTYTHVYMIPLVVCLLVGKAQPFFFLVVKGPAADATDAPQP
jgi:hypothetical protein